VPDTSASAPGAPPRRPARDPRGGNFLRPRRILRQIGRRKLSKGYRWLRAMQDAGDLPKHGGDRKSNAESRRLIPRFTLNRSAKSAINEVRLDHDKMV
jgi:hypothetical protein